MKKLKKELNANIDFLINLPREDLVKVLSRAKVYFHPTIGEHFGIPVVEAMAAGVIPIVPKESGASEVVPEFSYNNLDEASALLEKLIKENNMELRREVKRRSLNFSETSFKEKMFQILSEYV